VESRNVTFLGEGSPVFWEEAFGCTVRDVDGNQYLDLTAAFGVALAGHSHPRITAAIADQADRLVHGMGDVHPPELKLALLERLTAVAPWKNARVVLASSGSEAIEIALKTALLATGNPGILAFAGGYHGLTLGALAATERGLFRRPFESRLYGGVVWSPYPTERDGPAALGAALDFVEEAFAQGAPGGDRIGAVVIEPVQGRGGARLPAQGLLPGVAERARAAGALIVHDEVLTGFGRTGRLFAHEHEDVVPDLLCVGKPFGGGFPMSACLGPRRVMDAWPESEGEAMHTSTFLGHPMGCATALAFLDVLADEDLVRRSADVGQMILTGLTRGLEGVDGVLEVRGRGLLMGVELEGQGSAATLAEQALREGLLLLPAGEWGNVVELTPPATLSEVQIDHAVTGVTEVVRQWARAR